MIRERSIAALIAIDGTGERYSHMRDVTEVKLPGVGVRHDFKADSGETLGVVAHHDGRREVVVYDRDDPDACTSTVELSHDDARTLAELLGATQVAEEVAEVQHSIEEHAIAWIRVDDTSGLAGSTIAEGQLRTLTGASVVAVIRGIEPIPSPDPGLVLECDDLLLAVGNSAALDQLRHLVEPHP